MIITALLIGFLCLILIGIRMGYSINKLLHMALSGLAKAKNVIFVLTIVGILTAMWRADGTIAYIVTVSVKWFRPSVLILMIFLLNCLVSFITGTSFGTAATMGVISMTIAETAGASPLICGGAIISGCFFGDRCSPLSSSAMLVASVTDTDLFNNIRNMIKSAFIPWVLTCLVYFFAGYGRIGVIDTEFVSGLFLMEFRLNIYLIVPALIVLVLSVLKVDVKKSMAISILVAAALCMIFQNKTLIEIFEIMIFGFKAKDTACAEMINGGGLLSMKKVLSIVCISSTYSGIFSGTGMLEKTKKYIFLLAEKTDRFFCILCLSVLTSMVACNQTLAIMMTQQLGSSLYKEKTENFRMALDLEDSAVLIAALIPWSIAGAVPAATVGAPAACLLAAFYLYFVPLYRLIRK